MRNRRNNKKCFEMLNDGAQELHIIWCGIRMMGRTQNMGTNGDGIMGKDGTGWNTRQDSTRWKWWDVIKENDFTWIPKYSTGDYWWLQAELQIQSDLILALDGSTTQQNCESHWPNYYMIQMRRRLDNLNGEQTNGNRHWRHENAHRTWIRKSDGLVESIVLLKKPIDNEDGLAWFTTIAGIGHGGQSPNAVEFPTRRTIK